MREAIRTAFLILGICILAACQPLPSAVLQDESCSPPCWNGIIPGKTSLQEVSAKLKSVSAVDAKSIKTMSVLQANDSVDFHFLSNTRENGGRIYSQGGVVQAISFSPKSGTLILSEALQEWGTPDQYISIYYSKAETPYLATSIIYTERGIILNNIRNMRAEESPNFVGNFSIQSVWYTNPKLTMVLLENGSLDALNNQDLLDGLKPWTGYGQIHYIERGIWGVR